MYESFLVACVYKPVLKVFTIINKMPSTIDNFTCIKTLGSGISAKVKLATLPDGNRVALKIFDKTNPKNSQKAMETLKQEV